MTARTYEDLTASIQEEWGWWMNPEALAALFDGMSERQIRWALDERWAGDDNRQRAHDLAVWLRWHRLRQTKRQ